MIVPNVFTWLERGKEKFLKYEKKLADMNRDGNIRYFEYQNDKFEFLSEYKSSDPQRGVAFLPKRGINTHENEVMRAFKTVNDAYIEPISFIVPRRAEVFQDDIFPPVVGSKPAMFSAEWLEGKEGLPPKIDLGSIYAGEAAMEVPVENKPTSKIPSSIMLTSPPSSTTQDSEPSKQTSQAPRGPLPSIREQGNAIADLASNYADKDNADSQDEDNSSFEEVSKLANRSERKAMKPEKISESMLTPKEITSPTPLQASPKPNTDLALKETPSLQPTPVLSKVIPPVFFTLRSRSSPILES